MLIEEEQEFQNHHHTNCSFRVSHFGKMNGRTELHTVTQKLTQKLTQTQMKYACLRVDFADFVHLTNTVVVMGAYQYQKSQSR